MSFLSNFISAGSGPKRIVTYTSGTGTFVPLKNNSQIIAFLTGGGGGGVGGANPSGFGSGYRGGAGGAGASTYFGVGGAGNPTNTSSGQAAASTSYGAGGGGGCGNGNGGGGNPALIGGGGGGGGASSLLRIQRLAPIAGLAYTVGAGGTGGAANTPTGGTNGGNTVFAGLTSLGGTKGVYIGATSSNITEPSQGRVADNTEGTYVSGGTSGGGTGWNTGLPPVKTHALQQSVASTGVDNNSQSGATAGGNGSSGYIEIWEF